MSTPQPGWYQDPGDPGQQKWWDGREWTTYTMPLSGLTPPAVTEPDETHNPERTGRGAPAQGHAPPAQPAYSDYPGHQVYGAPQQGYEQGSPGYQPVNQGYRQGYPDSASAYPQYPGYQAFPGYQPAAPRSNPLALTGFILGLVGFFVFFIPLFGTAICLAAVIFSAVGLFTQKDRAPQYKVFGIIGLVLGIIFTLLSLLVTIAVFSSPYYY